MSITLETPEQLNEFFGRVNIREAAFEAVADGIMQETDRNEIQKYFTSVMTWHGDSPYFYKALVSELFTGAIRERKLGEEQPTIDLRDLEYIPYNYEV